MDTAQRLERAAQRLEEASELALSRSVHTATYYLGAASAVRALLRDLRRGHTPSASDVSRLSETVAVLADCAPLDSREQSRADGASLTLEGIAESLEEGL